MGYVDVWSTFVFSSLSGSWEFLNIPFRLLWSYRVLAYCASSLWYLADVWAFSHRDTTKFDRLFVFYNVGTRETNALRPSSGVLSVWNCLVSYFLLLEKSFDWRWRCISAFLLFFFCFRFISFSVLTMYSDASFPFRSGRLRYAPFTLDV